MLLQNDPHTAVILMTGNADLQQAIEAVRLGASDFLLKPFDITTVANAVRKAIDKRRVYLHSEHELMELKNRLSSVMKSTRAAAMKTMEAFCRTLEMRDIETFSHVERVSGYACCLAGKMGLPTDDQEVIRIGALLHDIGKVVVPDSILLKHGSLTEQEWDLMRKHVMAGYRIVSGIPGLERAAQIVLQHHERYGGGGYPYGLQGEQICLGARIFAVADSYDAITSTRPYRAAASDLLARNEIVDSSGTYYDPIVVRHFTEIPPEAWQLAATSPKHSAALPGSVERVTLTYPR